MSTEEPAVTPGAKWQRHTSLVYGLLAVCTVIILWSAVVQARCNARVARLKGEGWAEAKRQLVDMEHTSMRYVARAFYYDTDATMRARAGETLLATITRLAQNAPTETAALAEWQRRMRLVAESDMVSKALVDESPEVRELAGKIVALTGVEPGKEEGRHARWQNLERLLARLRQDPDKHVDAVLLEWRAESTVGDFGNSVLVGIIAGDASPAMRRAATKMLHYMLDAAYRADDREEMVKLVGHRRLRILLRLLADDVPGMAELLSFSPHFYKRNPGLVPGLQAKLKQVKAQGPEALERALDVWKDLYADIEEGQRGALRSKAVVEVLGKKG